jgi:hypothetical protein
MFEIDLSSLTPGDDCYFKIQALTNNPSFGLNHIELFDDSKYLSITDRKGVLDSS